MARAASQSLPVVLLLPFLLRGRLLLQGLKPCHELLQFSVRAPEFLRVERSVQLLLLLEEECKPVGLLIQADPGEIGRLLFGLFRLAFELLLGDPQGFDRVTRAALVLLEYGLSFLGFPLRLARILGLGGLIGGGEAEEGAQRERRECQRDLSQGNLLCVSLAVSADRAFASCVRPQLHRNFSVRGHKRSGYGTKVVWSPIAPRGPARAGGEDFVLSGCPPEAYLAGGASPECVRRASSRWVR